MTPESSESELDWVLVLAPFRKDADYLAALLREQKIAVEAVDIDADVARHLDGSPGVIVVTHEALIPRTIAQIANHLGKQPGWSEVPIIVLLERAAPIAKIRSQLEAAWPGSRLLFHTRPISALELVNIIQSNMLVRLRQRQVRDAIDRERELRLELNHRVKNILASVTSIFQMTRRRVATIEELADGFTGRMTALSDVHSAVFEAGGEEVALSDVVELTIAPYRINNASRIDASGPDMTVSRNAGTTIALCLHELITNAIKYGALSNSDGNVKITWAIVEGDVDRFALEWIEVDGPAVREPTREGYGTRYVRSALGSLLGAPPQISFAAGGFRCCASGPLSRLSPAI